MRRVALRFKRPNGTVFDNYNIRLGLKKYSTQGNIYNGGLLEPYLGALGSVYDVFAGSGKHVPCSRFEDGEIYIRISDSRYSLTSGTSGFLMLTHGYGIYSNVANIPTTTTIAASGKTYTFTVTLIDACTCDFTQGSNGIIKFSVLGSSGNVLADLYHVQAHAYTNTFDNGTASVTFTATENIVAVFLYCSNVSITNAIRIGMSLTEATT